MVTRGGSIPVPQVPMNLSTFGKKMKKISPYNFSTVYTGTFYFMCLRDQIPVFCDISFTKRVILMCINIDKTCRYVVQEVNWT